MPISARAIAAMPIAATPIAADRLRWRITMPSTTDDEFLDALTALEATLADESRRARLIKKRIAQIRRRRSSGESYTDIVSNNDSPLIVQLLTESSLALDTSGSDVRRAEARALYAEGLTMDQIAEHFGVTRQRVSTLLQRNHAPK
jgi:hypothetical protein